MTAEVRIQGVRIDPLTIDTAIERIVERAADPSAAAAYVVKPYVEFFPPTAETRRLLERAWLVLADGVALQWAASYRDGRPGLLRLGRSLADIVVAPQRLAAPIPERFAGITFTWPLLERAAEAGLSVVLVGSPKEQSVEATAAHLTERIPGLRISATAPGRGAAVEPDALAATIRSAQGDLVLVGIGFPRQERLIADLAGRLDHGVLIGEGGTFDYREFGGAIRRAPATLRRLGLEWLWRLLREPRRIRRQLAIPRFVARIHREAVRHGGGG
jgi:N-acetylglucosaminyldiphosphoundecaprenol N-acetyl-beta-D-mannosaminyltransferase